MVKLSKLTGKITGAIGAAVGGFFGGPLGAVAGQNLLGSIGPSPERLQNRQDNADYNRELADQYAMYERQFNDNKAMYELQKNDAISFWNMQNEYNSPAQQMKRLSDAGLNPMLVYGNGADNTSGAISTPSAQVPHISGTPRLSRAVRRREVLDDAVSKFFLNKSMENAEDQSRANALNEEYLSLRNELLRTKIQNYSASGNTSLKDAIDRLRYDKLLRELEAEPPLIRNGGSIGSLINSAYSIGKTVYGDLLWDGTRYGLERLSKWYNRPSGRPVSPELF